jgi:hypothetical protein
MREKYWTGVRPQSNRIMLILLPLVITMAVGLIVGIRLAGHGGGTLRLTSRGSGAPTPTAQHSGRRTGPAVPPTAPAPAPSPGAASPGAVTPSP